MTNGSRSARCGNRGATQDRITVVEHRCLARGYPARRLIEPDFHVWSVLPRGAGVDLSVGTELDHARDRRARRLAAGPDRADRGDLTHAESVRRTDRHCVADWLDG